MRVANVLAAIGVGLAIGTSAILAPLVLHGGESKLSNAFAGWAGTASRLATSVSSTAAGMMSGTKARPAADGADAIPTVVIAAPGQDRRTIDFLVQAEQTAGKTTASAAARPLSAQVAVVTEAAGGKMTSSKPASDEQRAGLVRNLQAELRRVGCYDGEINGVWSASARQAMAAFTERVNATLPYDQPDLILLTLVQGHKGRACGAGCPSGQVMAEAGRCLPHSVATHHAARPKREPTRDPVKIAVVEKPAAPVAKDTHAEVAATWATTTLAASPIETGSIGTATSANTKAVADAQFVPQAAPTRPVIPLPGRMAIGGPKPTIGETTAAAPAPVLNYGPKLVAATATTPTKPDPAVPVTDELAPTASPATSDKRPSHVTPSHAEPAHAERKPQATQQPRPRPATVTVHRPVSRGNSGSGDGPGDNASKSRRLVYEVFQRPDRN